MLLCDVRELYILIVVCNYDKYYNLYFYNLYGDNLKEIFYLYINLL